MMRDPASLQSRRRTGRRYAILLFIVLAMIAGWIVFWQFAADKAQATIDDWRVREAREGRVYECGVQNIGGFPFRFEVDCDKAVIELRSTKPPLQLHAAGLMAVMQIYQPTLLISEITGPVSIAEAGRAPSILANWTLAQISVRGTPRSPERASLAFTEPVVDRTTGGEQQPLIRAKRIEVHGRIVEGSASHNPVIESVLRLEAASAPGLHPAAAAPIDADITWVLRGLSDFSPKPWPARFRQIEAANGRIDVTQARVQQGPTLAVGSGTLSLNAEGRLEGELRVTIAGLEPFLTSIGAQKAIQDSSSMDKVAGALDRLLPGLGNVAREKAGAGISLGINLLEKQTSLEGKPAVTLPLRFTDGEIFLGPIPIGSAPALF